MHGSWGLLVLRIQPFKREERGDPEGIQWSVLWQERGIDAKNISLLQFAFDLWLKYIFCLPSMSSLAQGEFGSRIASLYPSLIDCVELRFAPVHAMHCVFAWIMRVNKSNSGIWWSTAGSNTPLLKLAIILLFLNSGSNSNELIHP